MRDQIVFGILLAGLAAAATAAEDTSRTYANPSCTERTANPDNCVIQNGPPRRQAFPAPQPPQPAPPPKAASGGGGNVTILGGGNANQGGR